MEKASETAWSVGLAGLQKCPSLASDSRPRSPGL